MGEATLLATSWHLWSRVHDRAHALTLLRLGPAQIPNLEGRQNNEEGGLGGEAQKQLAAAADDRGTLRARPAVAASPMQATEGRLQNARGPAHTPDARARSMRWPIAHLHRTKPAAPE